jgi:general secretion pathway protein D
MHHLVKEMIQIGTTQYERGYYTQAEKTLLMAQNYADYMTAAERSKLTELLHKAHSAALSARTVEQAQTARQLSKQNQRQAKPSSEAAVVQEKAAQDSQQTEGQVNDPQKRIAEVYYRSMRLYQNDQLKEAREGFIEIINSGSAPPFIVKECQEYVAKIDSSLANNTPKTLPSSLLQAEPDEQKPESNAAPPIKPDANNLRHTNSIISEPEVIEPKVAQVGTSTPQTIQPNRAEPVTNEGSYIDVIKRRRTIRQSHAQAVVNAAIAEARENLNNNNFDKAKEAVDRAERTINEYILDLGDDLYKQYSAQLKLLKEEISQAQNRQSQQLQEQKRNEATEEQRRFKEQMDAERNQRIKTLMENAKTFTKQQRYDAALGQLESLLALDPQNDEALTLKNALEDTIYFRKQLDMQKEKTQQRADILLKTEEAAIPYAEELVYPKNWREITEKPTRQPDKPIGMDPADVAVYQQLDRIIDLSRLTPTMPFGEAIDILRNSVDPPLKIVVLWRDLQDNAETDRTTPINMDRLPSVRLGTGLENLLKAITSGTTNLGYVVDSGVITIGRTESLPSKMVTRVYDITDLIGEPANFQQMGGMMGGMGGMGGGMGMMGGMGGMGGGMGGYGGGGMGGYGGGGGGYGGGGMGGGGYGGGGMGGGGYGGGGMGGGGYGGGMGGMGGMDNSRYRAEDLRYLIEDTISPYTWTETSDTGEGGTITTYPTGERPKKLAVHHTREVHAEIEKLLQDLRKALGHQVSIEARFLVVSENFLEDIGLDVDFAANLGGKWGQLTVAQDSTSSSLSEATKVSGSLGGISSAISATGGYGTILDDLQVSFILRMTQGRTDAETMTAPKATVLSGESASLTITDSGWYVTPISSFRTLVPSWPAGEVTDISPPQPQSFMTGTYLGITPIIMPDKKNVLLNITATLSELLRMRTYNSPGVTAEGNVYELPYTLPETETSNVMTRVSVPDGGTLLLGGQKISAEVEKEVGVPILSKIPILGAAFSNRSKVRDHRILLILVKPTIILQEERETEAIASLEIAQ